MNSDWRGVQLAPGLTGTVYSARWSGEIVAPADGDYLLGGSAADGFRLFLDAKKIVDDWGPHAERTRVTSVHLQAGHAYKIVMEYHHEDNRNPAARLLWSPPGMACGSRRSREESGRRHRNCRHNSSTGRRGDEHQRSGIFRRRPRGSWNLPRPQQELLEAVAATHKPLIVVLTSGSALAVNWAQDHAAAVLEAWYSGEEGGTALANIFAGDYNPSGRLPVTFYTERRAGAAIRGLFNGGPHLSVFFRRTALSLRLRPELHKFFLQQMPGWIMNKSPQPIRESFGGREEFRRGSRRRSRRTLHHPIPA